jgi:heat shock protein HslJ
LSRRFPLRNWSSRIGIGGILLILLLTACTPTSSGPTPVQTVNTQPVQSHPASATAPAAIKTPQTNATSSPAKPAALALTALQNLDYQIPDLGSVQLKDGHFEHKYGDGATQVNKVGYLQSVQGDLNGDGVQDAVIVLWATTGGSGFYNYIAGVINQNGKAQPTQAILLGDRIKIKDLSIQDGRITLLSLEAGPNDPQCCPSQQVTRILQLTGDTLKVTSEDQHGDSAATLTNTIWQWERYEEKDSANNIIANAPGKYLLTLAADGAFTVTADCNTASGSYTLSGTNLHLGPIEATLIDCPEGSLSAKYLNLLSQVSAITFSNGELVLETKSGKMFFTNSG